jgi:ring-1,2-phenylacetyl-CoA epoxidase subunit PaaD
VVGQRASLPTRDEVLAILDTVKDPEVPVLSVRDLGIVRDVSVDAAGAVTVTVTPTYSGCPAILVIEQDITSALNAAGIAQVAVRTTRVRSSKRMASLHRGGPSPVGWCS